MNDVFFMNNAISGNISDFQRFFPILQQHGAIKVKNT